MKKFIQQKLKDQKGMTLIELLAVIVIIAIIAAIAIPAIGNIIENSRVGAIKSDAQNALSAANIYFTDNDDADGKVTLTELQTGKYMQDLGSLPGTVTVNFAAGGNTITGTGTDGVKVEFKAATNSDINAAANNSSIGTAKVVITR